MNFSPFAYIRKKEFKYILDRYPSPASFSLRRISSTYTGPAIRIRRGTDNNEIDIGFVNDELNISAISTFVGSGNGFVVTWYDQSGNNRNLETIVSVSQPIIYSNGNLITQNGKPALVFNNFNRALRMPNGLSIFSNINKVGIFTTCKFDNLIAGTGEEKIIIRISTGINHLARVTLDGNGGAVSNIIRIGARRLDSDSFSSINTNDVNETITRNSLITGIIDYTNTYCGLMINNKLLSFNNSFLSSGNTSNTDSLNAVVGTNGSYNNLVFMKGNIQELILFNTDIQSNVNEINKNILNYYQIPEKV